MKVFNTIFYTISIAVIILGINWLMDDMTNKEMVYTLLVLVVIIMLYFSLRTCFNNKERK